jgi:hypothetical protein
MRSAFAKSPPNFSRSHRIAACTSTKLIDQSKDTPKPDSLFFAVRGGYTNALFNEQLVSREKMLEKLERLNAKMEREFPSMG